MVTKMAKNMVTKYGMSEELGTIAYGENEEEVFFGRSVTNNKICQKKQQKKLMQRLKKLLIKAYERARKKF